MKKYKLGIALISLLLLILFAFFRRSSHLEQRNLYVVLPLTGELSNIGQLAKKTVDAYLSINSNVSFKVTFVDAQSSPSKALSALSQATLREKSPLVICMFSMFSKVLVPYVNQRGGFSVPISTINMEEFQGVTGFQRVSNSIRDVISPIVSHANGRYSRVAVIYVNDEFGVANKDFFCSNFTGKVVSAYSFRSGDVNVRETVSRTIQKKPDAILLTGTPSFAYINVVRCLKEYGFVGDLLSDGSFTNPFVYKNLGETADDTLCSIHTCMIDGALSQPRFSEYGIPIYFLTIQMYDALSVIDQLCAMNLTISQEEFQKLGKFRGCSGEVLFLKDGNSEYEHILSRFKSGKFFKIGQR